MQPFWKVQPVKQGRGAGKRIFPRHAARHHGFCHNIAGADARDDTKELGNIPNALPPRFNHGARIGAGKVKLCPAMRQHNAPCPRAVIAVKAAHQRGFPCTRRAGKRHAFASADRKINATQHRNACTALQMKREGFRKTFCAQKNAHAANTEDTRSCV